MLERLRRERAGAELRTDFWLPPRPINLALATSPFAALAQTTGGAALKIGTIGSGREGGALGTLFAKAGHPVMFSSRHPEQLKDLVASAGPSAKAGTVSDAIAFADVVLLVVPYTAVEQIGNEHGPALAKKQLVMDVSNPVARRDGEELVKWVYAKLPELAHRQGDPVGVPIAGDDQKAVALASQLIKEIGFEPVVVGGLAMGKYLNVGTPLAGIHTPDEIRQIASTLK